MQAKFYVVLHLQGFYTIDSNESFDPKNVI